MEARQNRDNPELRAWTDMFSADRGRSLGVVETAGGTALVAAEVDSLLFNRAFVGDVDQVEELGRIYEDRGIDRYMITLPPTVTPIADSGLGLERFHRPWLKLAGRPKAQTVELDGYL